jgi:FkbM family methyltransferase
VSLGYDFRDDFDSEKDILLEFINDLEENDIVYDIGANVGIYSAFAGNVLTDGEIIAFEPHPVAVPVLYRNLSANSECFEIIQLGVSNRSGFGKMQITGSTGADTNSDSGVNVPLEKIYKVVKNDRFKKPDVVKIDVEGGEKEVLSGFGDFISELELLYVEVHHEKMDQFESEEYDIETELEKQFATVNILGQTTRETTVTHIKATDR